jgi:hypothetical protein
MCDAIAAEVGSDIIMMRMPGSPINVEIFGHKDRFSGKLLSFLRANPGVEVWVWDKGACLGIPPEWHNQIIEKRIARAHRRADKTLPLPSRGASIPRLLSSSAMARSEVAPADRLLNAR